MLRRSLKAAGFLCLFLVASIEQPDIGFGQARPDSLTLQQPQNIFVVPVMSPNRLRFVNYIFWEDVPDSLGTFIHQPDTTGWNAPTSTTAQESLSVPTSSGAHTGNIDRTIKFRALNSGRVGQTSFQPDSVIVLRFEIIAEEVWNREINVGRGYTPNDPIPCVFINELTGDSLDLGLNLHFSPGLVDSNGVLLVGLEDFEGFHIWRAINRDGSDMTVLGELSKEEEFRGRSEIDFIYFNAILPALRSTGVFVFPFPVPGLGTALDITGIHPNGRLGPNELAWFDVSAFNGFTYYYTVTSFDRGYNIPSHSQGLFKFDNCPVAEGVPYPCASELVPLSTNVTPQTNLMEVYAVPNPYRSGTSQFTTPNYHNFPDNKIRFVNVPADCKIRIYTISGDFVFEINNTGGTGNIEWDTRNSGGEEVGSGAYIFRCENKNGEGVYGRVIIIR